MAHFSTTSNQSVKARGSDASANAHARKCSKEVHEYANVHRHSHPHMHAYSRMRVHKQAPNSIKQQSNKNTRTHTRVSTMSHTHTRTWWLAILDQAMTDDRRNGLRAGSRIAPTHMAHLWFCVCISFDLLPALRNVHSWHTSSASQSV